jgi:hypothetical protein
MLVEKYQGVEADRRIRAKRQHQALSWMWQLIDSGLRQHFRNHPRVQESLPALKQFRRNRGRRRRLPPRMCCSTTLKH